MATPTGTDPHHAPIPPGWPGDDPTVPEDLDALGTRRRRPARPSARLDPAAQPRGPRIRRPPRDPDPDERGASGSLDDDPGGVERASVVDLDEVDDLDDLDGDLEQDDDLVAGVQPAGRVLVVMVAALVLAMLVNADALVERAERAPAGSGRDRSLAIWHPVQDVSHVLQLFRIRQLAEWAVGDADEAPVAPPPSGRDARRPPGGAGSQPSDDRTGEGGDASGGAPAAATVALRTPTADDPLRLWVGGDSMAQPFGESLVAASEATGLVDPTRHYEPASGLTRPDYYDWPRALADDVDAHDPEVVVLLVGSNDGQGIVLPDGTPIPQVSDPRWAVEYRRRVGALMDQLEADDRLVVWVGQPPMREPGFGGRIAVINQAYVAEAADRPWVTFVDPAAVLADPSGAFVQVHPDAAGTPVEVRRDDGIHLTTAGGDLLAAHVLEVVGAHVDLSGATGGAAGD